MSTTTLTVHFRRFDLETKDDVILQWNYSPQQTYWEETYCATMTAARKKMMELIKYHQPDQVIAVQV